MALLTSRAARLRVIKYAEQSACYDPTTVRVHKSGDVTVKTDPDKTRTPATRIYLGTLRGFVSMLSDDGEQMDALPAMKKYIKQKET